MKDFLAACLVEKMRFGSIFFQIQNLGWACMQHQGYSFTMRKKLLNFLNVVLQKRNLKKQKMGNTIITLLSLLKVKQGFIMLCQYLYQGRTSNVPVYNRYYSRLKCIHMIYIMFSTLFHRISLRY